jgi:hypothetical protein
MKKLSYSAEAAMLLARRRITIYAVVTMMMMIVGTAQADFDIHGIYINSCKNHWNGIPETTNPWIFETGISWASDSLDHIDVTKPSDSTPFTTIYEVDGGWGYESPSCYLDLAALQGEYPTGNYTFDFRNNINELLSSVTMDYSGISEPTEAVNFTYPSMNGQTVSINPTFTWTVSPTAGDVLAMSVWDVLTDETVYDNWMVPMTTTSWTPGPLLPNHEYGLEVNVLGIKNGVPYDSLLSIQYCNFIEFTTVPEPTTICLFGLGALSLIRRKK